MNNVRLLLLIFLSVCTSIPTASSEALKVGIILPLTGHGASLGEAVKNGINLAYKKLPPNEQQQLLLFYEDDQSQPQFAVSAFQKLKTTDEIDVLLNASSTTGKAIAPLSERAKITFLSLAVDPLISRGRPHTFNFWVTPERLSELAVKECQLRGYKRIALVSTIHEGTRALVDAFLESSKGEFEIVLHEQFPPEMKDFRSSILRLKGKQNIDVIFNQLYLGQLGVFSKQARDLGLTLPSFALINYSDRREIEMASGALSGQWYIDSAEPKAEFVREFRKNYPNSSLLGASNGYDVLMLLASWIRKRERGVSFVNYLRSVKDFEGVTGAFSASGDNRFTLEAALKVVP